MTHPEGVLAEMQECTCSRGHTSRFITNLLGKGQVMEQSQSNRINLLPQCRMQVTGNPGTEDYTGDTKEFEGDTVNSNTVEYVLNFKSIISLQAFLKSLYCPMSPEKEHITNIWWSFPKFDCKLEIHLDAEHFRLLAHGQLGEEELSDTEGADWRVGGNGLRSRNEDPSFLQKVACDKRCGTILRNIWVSHLMHTSLLSACTELPVAAAYLKRGKDVSYQKFGVDMKTVSEMNYMESDDIPSSALDLEWDMETELEELGSEHFQPDNFANHNINSAINKPHIPTSSQLSTSPKGRFQRLEEEPEYFSHCAHLKTKTSKDFCTVMKAFSIVMFTFILGILVGYFSKTIPSSSNCLLLNELTTSSEIHTINEILNDISKENIETHYRYFTEISVNKTDSDPVKKIALLWTSIGLKEVQLVNYSVLLDLPGSSPNTITLKNGQCYYPSGQDCDEETKSQEFPYTYAAYSASGSLEGKVIDVQYGTIDDLQSITNANNISRNSIALIKLGVLPLLHKLSLLEDIGFGGVLIYLDPCDLPEGKNSKDKSFMVSLKYGINQFSIDSLKTGNIGNVTPNVTSLLVQPVTISLLRRLFSLTESTVTGQCLPIKVPETDAVILTLNIQSTQAYKEISNSVAFLRGSLLPDKYIIIGSSHYTLFEENNKQWASGAAIMTSIISSIISKMKSGWRPQRTIIFCSWGGAPFGNIGSYKWGKDFQRILTSNAVTYIGLQNSISGNGSLRSVSSPSLRQLATEVIKKVQISCARRDICQTFNVSSVQTQGDADFFINQLGIPATQFIFEDNKTKAPNLLTEVSFITYEESYQQLDPFFLHHEYIAKLTAQMVLQIVTEPVLPFNALDIALEIQKRIEGNIVSTGLREISKLLRETTQLFQSNEMRPANDPKERDPTRVRMLNDILQNMEKNFLISSSPLGFFRNILYSLDGNSSQFSVVQEAQEYCKITKSNETLLTTLQEVLNCISSAQLYFKESLHLFESESD
ncbi:PREDICTED: inactive N-acetylated-alpha-linked acidic dipeptidase-like protein 2 [Nanorana parkeri]|uniref:inactive N-acetylated-alpha-linked acidic dipeptidase-like protein 2 n=1 Tax=Nanorana parkeri TaxID=125878 RepID=UPI00085426CA|nr:PREDICTED: inactive N-acetylated-alpha-linked acidic dipeptidase-like protein 2 [Nanorana parkeri]